jgi:flagellin-specific chaperone FliS
MSDHLDIRKTKPYHCVDCSEENSTKFYKGRKTRCIECELKRKRAKYSPAKTDKFAEMEEEVEILREQVSNLNEENEVLATNIKKLYDWCQLNFNDISQRVAKTS